MLPGFGSRDSVSYLTDLHTLYRISSWFIHSSVGLDVAYSVTPSSGRSYFVKGVMLPFQAHQGHQAMPLRQRPKWPTFQQFTRRQLLIIALFLVLILGLSTFFPRSKAKQEPAPAFPGPYEALVEAGEHGFLPLDQARDICQRRRFEPYAARDRRRKVYDLFLINTELDFLEIRLNELDKQVDYFVILESATTFQMNPKPLYLKDNLAQFKAFQHKIIHRVLDDAGAKKLPKDDTWEQERHTRNALFDQAMLSLTGPQTPNEGDVLIVGDIDEIPRIETLTALRNCAFPPRVTLRSQMYYYSYQWLHRGDLWHHPQATYYDGPEKTIKPESLRMDKADVELYMSGWHCSSCFGTMADLKNKITSFSHKHYNQPYFLDTKKLLGKVRRGEDLFERAGELYDRIDDNPDVPVYLQTVDSRQKFAYMLDRDPENANFQDL